MKKQIIYSSIIAATLWGGTALVVLNNASAKETTKEETTNLIAESSTMPAKKQVSASKNETVYVVADETGNTKTKFIGSTIYNGDESLPFNFKITYYLDGNEISAKDLAGKSGHVKIVYTYDSTAQIYGKNIPFLAVTGMTLDSSYFSNIKTTNGKILSETSGNTIIAGYSFVGMNEDLNVDFLPNTFILEADTTNFKLKDTYTIFMNDIIADLDTSKLASLDSITNSIYELSNGLNQILSGATELSNGLASALDGTKTLYTGSQTLAAGLKDAATGAAEASVGATKLSGLTTLANYNDALNDGAAEIFTGILATTSTTLSSQISAQVPGFSISLTKATYKAQLEGLKTQMPPLAETLEATKQKLISIETFCTQLRGYTDKVAEAAAGASKLATGLDALSAGLTKLSAGADTLSAGLGSLVEGETKLYNGSVTLRDGINTFKVNGIDKLVNFVSNNLSTFTANVRSTVSAASSYRSFGNVEANSVKFIVKTPSI